MCCADGGELVLPAVRGGLSASERDRGFPRDCLSYWDGAREPKQGRWRFSPSTSLRTIPHLTSDSIVLTSTANTTRITPGLELTYQPRPTLRGSRDGA